jgi:hypothetical protein
MKSLFTILFLFFAMATTVAQQNIDITPKAVKISGNLSVRDSLVIGTNIVKPQAPFDVNGNAIFRGINSNTLGTPQAGVEFFFGRGATNAIPNGLAKSDIAFNWGGAGGGFRHYITTRHEGAANNENNAFDFYLNNTNLQHDNPMGNSPAFSITAIGNKIYTNNFLEFGAGLSKEPNAGKIGYKLFSNALDIVGAGSVQSNRRITLFAEGGANVIGNLAIGSLDTPTEKFYVNGNVKVETDMVVSGSTAVHGSFNATSKLAAGTGIIPLETFFVQGDSKMVGNTALVGHTTIEGTASVTNDITVAGNVNAGYNYQFRDHQLEGNRSVSLLITCSEGTYLLSGGGGSRDQIEFTKDIVVNYTGPDADNPTTKWRLTIENTSNSLRNIRIYCTCARIN